MKYPRDFTPEDELEDEDEEEYDDWEDEDEDDEGDTDETSPGPSTLMLLARGSAVPSGGLQRAITWKS